jgi:hypothetical protein
MNAPKILVAERPGLTARDVEKLLAEHGHRVTAEALDPDQLGAAPPGTSGKHLLGRSFESEALQEATRLVHDLNNALSGVEAYSRFVAEELPEDHPCARDAKVALESGVRAVQLVSELREVFRRAGRLGQAEVTSAVWPRARPVKPR